MTRDEAKKALMVVQAAYPNYHPQDKTVTADLWASMFGDYDYRTVMAALKAYIMTDKSGFAPSIGQIFDKMQITNTQPTETPMEAWAKVRKAINNSGYGSAEEFDKLSPNAQRAVGSAEQLYSWATSESFNEGVVMSQFIRVYNELAEKKSTMRITQNT